MHKFSNGISLAVFSRTLSKFSKVMISVDKTPMTK
jgi:hypothetical protein